jgi:phospholipase/lecithinase/hemolysin
MTQAYNSALAASLDRLETERFIRIDRLDLFDLAHRVVADARDQAGAVYGITNWEVPIFEGAADSPGADPSISLFADALHISAVAHRHLGNAAAAIVPEPSSVVLITPLLPLIAACLRWNPHTARRKSIRLSTDKVGQDCLGPRCRILHRP